MLERYTIMGDPQYGGMGVTFKALDNNLNRHVLIKNIKEELLKSAEDQKHKQLFKDEAIIQASLSHNNIAQVYDYFEFEGNDHIVFKLANGNTLDKIDLFTNIVANKKRD